MLSLPPFSLASRELVALANEKGGKDNISIILVELQEAYSDTVGLDVDDEALEE